MIANLCFNFEFQTSTPDINRIVHNNTEEVLSYKSLTKNFFRIIKKYRILL